MYTGRDPYYQMDVMINVGDCKGHAAVVIGTRQTASNVLVDVRTTTKVENALLTFDQRDVTHLQ
jgi:hypothetical protein